MCTTHVSILLHEACYPPTDSLIVDKKPQAHNPKGGRNKFVEPASPLIPPPIPVWRDALLAVDTNPSNCISNPSSSDNGYIFPDPGLFVGVTTPEKQALYFQNWLKYRTEIIFRLVSDKSSARPVSNHLWRTLLNFGDTPVAEGLTTKTAKRRLEILELLGNCINEEGISLTSSSSPSDIFWRDQQLASGSIPQENIGQEILWELFELNFRFEFLALDRRACSSAIEDETARQDGLLACFVGHRGGSLLLADIEFADKGLASKSWSDRVPYLLAMRRLMKDWRGAPQSLTDFTELRPTDYSEAEVILLERTMALFYTQSFFNHFGRAAMVPHRLH